jgi:thioredoxin
LKTEDYELKRILERCRVIAVVGLSRNPGKDSHIVARYLKEKGYQIIPINPSAEELLGEKTYKDLGGVPEELQKRIDVVCIFRPSEEVPRIMGQVLEMKEKLGKPEVVWMQLGVVNREAAEEAEAVGTKVVMDRCMMMDHKRLIGERDEELERIKQKKLEALIKRLEMKKITAPIQLRDSDFDDALDTHTLILVDFWAPWCGPCHIIAPIVEELAEEYSGKVYFGKLNVDENPLTARRFGVRGIPTLILFKNGKEVARIVGVVPKTHIQKEIEKHLA